MKPIVLSDDTEILLNTIGTVVVCPSGKTYKYLPYWFKEEGNGVYTPMSFEKLPKELIENIKRMRNELD